MKKHAKLFLLFLLLSTIKIYSQGEGALPFTTLQQSPLLLGAGQIGAAIPSDDVIGFYYNPAILGYTSLNNHASIYFMPNNTNLAPPVEYVTINNYGLGLGYNLKTTKLDLPISLGLGYIHNKIDYGRYPIYTNQEPVIVEETESYDLFDCFSLGIGIDYYIKFNLGISLKSFESQLGGRFVDGAVQKYLADGTMLDYGALLIFPISDLLLKNVKFEIDNSNKISPITNFSIGYSLTNVGDEIFYVDEAQKDPLSRTARLGYTFDLGFDLELKEAKINLINYSFTAEANDILIESRDELHPNLAYQSGLGDNNISDDLISLKSNNKIVLHRGHIFRFLDTFILTSGSFNGRGYAEPRETNGLGFTTKGIFKLINSSSDNCTIKYITNHFVIEYFKANLDYIENNQINFDGLSIHFVGFEI